MRHSSIRLVGSGEDGCCINDSGIYEDTSFRRLPSRRAGDHVCHQLHVQWHLATTQTHSRASVWGWYEARLTESASCQ